MGRREPSHNVPGIGGFPLPETDISKRETGSGEARQAAVRQAGLFCFGVAHCSLLSLQREQADGAKDQHNQGNG